MCSGKRRVLPTVCGMVTRFNDFKEAIGILPKVCGDHVLASDLMTKRI
jgi:hypothetical protein